jgi:GT2 family glycosyltransferase
VAPTKISIIIPLLHSPVIAQTLASVWQQDFDLDTVEVLVVGLDGHHLVLPHPRLQFIETDVSVSEARNIGFRASRGDHLVFLDSDCVASKQWLQRLVGCLEQGRPVVGGGVAVSGGSYYATCYNITTFHEFLDVQMPGQRDYLPTLNLAMHRQVFEGVGELDKSLPRAEDIDWTVRMKARGYPLYFEPRAVIHHIPRTSLGRIWTKWVNTGYCSRDVRQRHPYALESPPILNSAALLIAGSPFIALIAATRIFWRTRALLHYLHTWPVIYLTKLAWCWGAAAEAGTGWLEKIIMPSGKLST